DSAVQAVEDLLAVAAIADDVAHPQQPEVMTHRRLRQLELLAKAGDVSLASAEQKQDDQPRLVRQQPKQCRELLQVLTSGPHIPLDHSFLHPRCCVSRSALYGSSRAGQKAAAKIDNI